MRPRFVLFFPALVLLPLIAAAQSTQSYPNISFGGYVQSDYLAPIGEPEDVHRTFRFRRVRLGANGALSEKIDWAVTYELTTTPGLRDAFISLEYLPAATIQIGQFVMPFGQEQYVFSSNTMAFTERLLNRLMASRDAGIMVSNRDPFGGWFSYAVAVANGTRQNEADDNDAKDVILRLSATPPALAGLRVSASVSRGDQPDGMRIRRGADLSLERRRFHLAAEFVAEDLDGLPRRDGFYAFGAWRLYPVAPRPYFHHLELGSRYGRLTGAEPLEQWDVSANYYVFPNVRFMTDYVVRTERAPGVPGRMFQARANIRF